MPRIEGHIRTTGFVNFCMSYFNLYLFQVMCRIKYFFMPTLFTKKHAWNNWKAVLLNFNYYVPYIYTLINCPLISSYYCYSIFLLSISHMTRRGKILPKISKMLVHIKTSYLRSNYSWVDLNFSACLVWFLFCFVFFFVLF